MWKYCWTLNPNPKWVKKGLLFFFLNWKICSTKDSTIKSKLLIILLALVFLNLHHFHNFVWWKISPILFLCLCSGPSARLKRRQSGRVVEVHRQHHFRLQTRPAPHPSRRPVTVGSCQGCCLQVPQDQAWEEVLAPGHRWRLPRTQRRCRWQRKPANSLEGPVGAPAEEVSAAWQEGKVLEDPYRNVFCHG